MKNIVEGGTRRTVIGSILVGAGLALAISSQPSLAGEVVLKSFNKKVTLTGEIVGVDRYFYLLRTSVGVLSVNSDIVTCEGYSCPELNIMAAITEEEAPKRIQYTSSSAEAAYAPE